MSLVSLDIVSKVLSLDILKKILNLSHVYEKKQERSK